MLGSRLDDESEALRIAPRAAERERTEVLLCTGASIPLGPDDPMAASKMNRGRVGWVGSDELLSPHGTLQGKYGRGIGHHLHIPYGRENPVLTDWRHAGNSA